MAGVVLVVTPNVTSMAIPTLLESAPSKSDVGLDLVGVFSSNLRLVDNALYLPVPVGVALSRQEALWLPLC